ncbi:MAG TPA: ribokinase [Casimicrobiaceae bacterium]
MIVVFGSINLDLVTRVARFPAPGETVGDASFATYPGGKGANQALAAARAGASVRMVGAVGSDAFVEPALSLLSAGGVDLHGVARVAAPTGCATILVDAHGENCIAVAPGANALADSTTVPDRLLTPETIVVLQHEVPAHANAALIVRAHRLGARIVLNAAPARPLSIELLRQVDVLVVNEAEASAAVPPVADAPELAVAITLGARGAMLRFNGTTVAAPAPKVAVVDSTGAGDAFVGALVAALDAGAAPAEGLRFGVAAGSLACTAAGAQPALPDRAAIAATLPFVTARPVPSG